jgi:cytochrome oxidase assembly protein ShyY1
MFSLTVLEDMEYRKVKVRGTFDYSKEMLLGPRSLFNYAVDAPPTGGGLFTGGGASLTGYHVITPFHLEDRKWAAGLCVD